MKTVIALVVVLVAAIAIPGYLFQSMNLNIHDEYFKTKDANKWRWAKFTEGGLEMTEFQKNRQNQYMKRSQEATERQSFTSWFGYETSDPNASADLDPGNVQGNPFAK